MTQSNYPREFSIFTHTQLIEFWPTDIFEECERVGFHPSKTFAMSFIIPWRVNIMRFHPKSFLFLFFFANLSFLFIFIYCYPSFFLRTGMEIIFKFSFLWTHLKLSHLAHGDACIYAHIAYYIVPLWFWLIVWGEFLMRVLDWNVKTINQWQIAWTKLWKLLEFTFAGTLVGELVELPWAELMWI